MTSVAASATAQQELLATPNLQAIPRHWSVRRLKYCARVLMGQSPPGHECGPGPGLPFLQGCAEFGRQFPMADQYCAYPPKAAPQGSILLSVRAPVGRLNRADREYGIGRGLCAVIPDNRHLLADFAFYLLEASHGQLLTSATGSTYDAVTVNDIGDHSMTLPPISEQARITSHLDSVTEDTEAAVASLQRQIELLTEQQLGVVEHAVTQGLDGSVHLRASGVPWLGDVPEHWEVSVLRRRYSQCLGKMLDAKRITGRYLLPYLRNVDVQWDRINTENLAEMDITPAEYERYTLRPGDLIVCEGGEVGRCAIWLGTIAHCGFQKALHRLRPHDAARDVPRFLYYTLRAAAERGAFADGGTTTISHLTGEKLRRHRLPFPPKSEQASIVAYLDRATADFEAAVAGVRREIELLTEYRARLIADVVTGRLDVREAADGLSEPRESGA